MLYFSNRRLKTNIGFHDPTRYSHVTSVVLFVQTYTEIATIPIETSLYTSPELRLIHFDRGVVDTVVEPYIYMRAAILYEPKLISNRSKELFVDMTGIGRGQTRISVAPKYGVETVQKSTVIILLRKTSTKESKLYQV